MKFTLPLIISLLCVQFALAAGKDSTEKKAAALYRKPLFDRPMAVSAHLGTTGIGAALKLGILPRVNARLAVSFLPVGLNAKNIKLSGYPTDVEAKSNFTSIQLLGEIRPFKRSSFRFVAGFGYFASGKLETTIQPVGDFHYGDIDLTREQVGKMIGTADWKGIAPYIGIGLFNSLPKKKFNVTLDMGMFYLPKPEFTLEGDKLLVGNEENGEIIEKNIEGYRWMPQLQVNFNYRIH